MQTTIRKSPKAMRRFAIGRYITRDGVAMFTLSAIGVVATFYAITLEVSRSVLP